MNQPNFDVHYFPLYISRWRDSDTRVALNLEQRMLYWELIFFCYRNGSAPNDRQSLVKITGSSEKEFDRAWPKVKGLFREDGSRLHHNVVDQILTEQQDKHNKRARAGSLGGAAKSSNATNLLEQKASKRLASEQNRTEQNKEEEQEHIPAPSVRGREKYFIQFWEVVWARIGKGAAMKAWNKKANSKELALRIIHAARIQGPALLRAASLEGRQVIHPATWINQERYLDELPGITEPEPLPEVKRSSRGVDPNAEYVIPEEWRRNADRG